MLSNGDRETVSQYPGQLAPAQLPPGSGNLPAGKPAADTSMFVKLKPLVAVVCILGIIIVCIMAYQNHIEEMRSLTEEMRSLREENKKLQVQLIEHAWSAYRQEKLQEGKPTDSEKPQESVKTKKETSTWNGIATGAAAIVGGTAAIAAAPAVLAGLGFTSAGIAAGSVAASTMALLKGSAVGTTIVAGLQSAGAAGLGIGAKAAVASAGAAAGYFVNNYVGWLWQNQNETSTDRT